LHDFCYALVMTQSDVSAFSDVLSERPATKAVAVRAGVVAFLADVKYINSSEISWWDRLPLLSLTLSIFCILAISRLVLEGFFLLPSPTGDSIFFLDPAHNYCSRGFLGTELISLDPKEQNRFVWHGFLFPWILSRLNFSCSIIGFYWVALAIKAFSVVFAFFVARDWGIVKWQAVLVSILVLAVQSKFGFRPDLLAITWILAIELALKRNRRSAGACFAALLLWTQPTVFGLYGLLLILQRFVAIRSAVTLRSAFSFVVTFSILGYLYPFPLMDLVEGLRQNASLIFSRGVYDDFWTYYGVTHFAPLWALLFSAALLILLQKNLWLLLILPFLWWFGPRVPPTNYNLIALLPVVVILGIASCGKKGSALLAVGVLGVGAIGLAELSLRDIATVLSNNSYYESRDAVLADIQNSELTIGELPGFSLLWVRESGMTLPVQAQRLKNSDPTSLVVHHIAIAGAPNSPCPKQSPNSRGAFIFGYKISNSTSGWESYRCLRESFPTPGK
jgi:hypothetical protein